nr:uncharacterized protein LOC109158519 [Ipomoea batatas]
MDELQCKLEARELEPQEDLFTSLLEWSISTFADLLGKFMSYFASSIPKKKQFANMCKLEQWSTETLTDYLTRWKKEARSLENFDEKAAILIFTSNVRSRPFHCDLVQNPPKTYAALLDRAARFAEAEEAERKKKKDELVQGQDKAPQEELIQHIITTAVLRIYRARSPSQFSSKVDSPSTSIANGLACSIS